MKEQNNATRTTEMITISRAEYDAQKARITELENQVEWFMEQLRLLKKKQRAGRSAGQYPGGGGGAPPERGRSGMPAVRGDHAGDRQRGT